MIYVRPDLRPLFSSESRVADFLNIQGEVFKRIQHRRTPGRWVAKDLSALLYSGLFSCPRLVLTRRDCLRFMAAYSGTDWRTALTAKARLWRRVARRTLRVYARHERGRPVTPSLLLGQA